MHDFLRGQPQAATLDGIGGDIVELASGFGATVRSFSRSQTGTDVSNAEDIEKAFAEAAKGADLIRLRALMKQRRHRPLLLIDLAVPRAVPAALGDVDGVYVGAGTHILIEVDPSIATAIRARNVIATRGRHELDPLDSHALPVRRPLRPS